MSTREEDEWTERAEWMDSAVPGKLGDARGRHPGTEVR